MRFLPLETCKKLDAMGCKSESLFHWYISPIGPGGHSSVVLFQSFQGPTEAPAFCLEDFLGSHKQALVNCNTMLRNISTELKEVFWGMGILNSSDWQKSLVCTEDWVENIKELVA